MIIEREGHLEAVQEDNVHYMDEYPHLAERLRVRRVLLGLGRCATQAEIIYLPDLQ